jgi:ubiquinone/menaquinone biosynthesis C-methylase UbiE
MHRRLPSVHWDAVAPFYDAQLRLERPALAAAIELTAVAPEERLLDVGTGTGAVLRALAKRAPRPDEAIGLDASTKMLARLGELPECWRTVRADARALPFPASRFEVAFCSYLLHLLDAPGRAEVLAEIRRVLVPGGRFVTVTPVAPPTLFGRGLERVAGRYLLDPRDDLELAGFAVRAARYVRAGYPSLCVLSERDG